MKFIISYQIIYVSLSEKVSEKYKVSFCNKRYIKTNYMQCQWQYEIAAWIFSINSSRNEKETNFNSLSHTNQNLSSTLKCPNKKLSVLRETHNIHLWAKPYALRWWGPLSNWKGQSKSSHFLFLWHQSKVWGFKWVETSANHLDVHHEVNHILRWRIKLIAHLFSGD